MQAPGAWAAGAVAVDRCAAGALGSCAAGNDGSAEVSAAVTGRARVVAAAPNSSEVRAVRRVCRSITCALLSDVMTFDTLPVTNVAIVAAMRLKVADDHGTIMSHLRSRRAAFVAARRGGDRGIMLPS